MTESRSRTLRAAAAARWIVVAALGLAAALAAADAPASGSARTGPPALAADLRAAPAPNEPVLGLKYFKVDPEGAPRVYRLLVIPVRFPEDDDLGGGGREGLLARLAGDGPETLEGFYAAITFGRVAMEVTLAPTVIAEHRRSWYTAEGENNFGYGLDVNAYPHNSRSLVEEVTRKVTGAVDLRRFDNTGDGIADGLLVLHSGPPAPEAVTPDLPRSLMAAHSFSLDAPVLRGDTWVFPYSIASVYDPLGPWAHETGHLFGLVDLYVPNDFCPGEGLGTWSLMATGANQNGGENPTGLDAFSLQLLGFEPVIREAPTGILTLGGETFLRVFRAGQSRGSEYFLVERRLGGVEPGVPASATLIYSVDEGMVDNRTCGRPLVAVRAVIGPEASGSIVLDDDTQPSLRDRNGDPTNLWLWVDGARVVPAGGGAPATDLASVRLGGVLPGAPGRSPSQRLELTVLNLYPLDLDFVTVEVNALSGANLCAVAPAGPSTYAIPSGDAVVDTSWVIEACGGTGLPSTAARFEVVVSTPGPGDLRDTVTIAVNQHGLAEDRLSEFTAVNLAPGRTNPWIFDEEDSTWTAEDLGVLADAEITSPWFLVPEGGVLVLEHEWDLDAVAPDLALDAAAIRLETQLGADVELAPELGWGHAVARGVGNALGGADALSGTGDRVHVLDLSAHARETVRLRFRVAGDVEGGSGRWRISSAAVNASPYDGSFTLEAVSDRRVDIAGGGEVPADTRITVYSGPVPATPSGTIFDGRLEDVPPLEADGDPGTQRRLDLIWRYPDGGGGSHEIVLDLPPEPRALHPPYPNPLSRGATQTWSLEVPAGSPPGVYHVLLVDAAGRRIREERIAFAVAGRRSLVWDGLDSRGRPVPAGVYFLRVRGPEGRSESRRLVVLP